LLSVVKGKLFYGWVVALSFFIAGTTLWGVRLSYGIFFKSIEGEFELSRAVTSAVPALAMLLGGGFTVLGGWALDRYGPRLVVSLMGLSAGLGLLLTSQTSAPWQLFITYSLLVSIGTSAVYVVTMSTVSRWFRKKRGLALGIASSGGGLGTVIIAPFATYLISTFTWRIAYIIIGLITLLVILSVSMLLKRDPHEIGALPDGQKLNSGSEQQQVQADEAANLRLAGLSLPQAMKTRSFWLVMVMLLFVGACLLLIQTHLVPHATDIGISATDAAFVFSLLGAAAVVGRVTMGVASDRIGRKAALMTCILLEIGAMLWLIWSRELWMLYLFALVYGFGQGGFSPSMAALNSEVFGLRNLGVILGLTDIGWGTGAAIGPFIGGFIFDFTGQYYLAFVAGAAGLLVTALAVLFIKRQTGGQMPAGAARK